jgi:hypothetical protein
VDAAQADGNATDRFVAFVGQVDSWLNIDVKLDAMAMEGQEEYPVSRTAVTKQLYAMNLGKTMYAFHGE